MFPYLWCSYYKIASQLGARTTLGAKRRFVRTRLCLCLRCSFVWYRNLVLMTWQEVGERYSPCLTKVSLTKVYDFCSKALPTKEWDFEVDSLFSHACYGFLKKKKKTEKPYYLLANSLYAHTKKLKILLFTGPQVKYQILPPSCVRDPLNCYNTNKVK